MVGGLTWGITLINTTVQPLGVFQNAASLVGKIMINHDIIISQTEQEVGGEFPSGPSACHELLQSLADLLG